MSGSPTRTARLLKARTAILQGGYIDAESRETIRRLIDRTLAERKAPASAQGKTQEQSNNNDILTQKGAKING